MQKFRNAEHATLELISQLGALERISGRHAHEVAPIVQRICTDVRLLVSRTGDAKLWDVGLRHIFEAIGAAMSLPPEMIEDIISKRNEPDVGL